MATITTFKSFVQHLFTDDYILLYTMLRVCFYSALLPA